MTDTERIEKLERNLALQRERLANLQKIVEAQDRQITHFREVVQSHQCVFEQLMGFPIGETTSVS